MATIKDLPNELLLEVVSYIPDCLDLAAFVATCRRHHDVVSRTLYERDAKPTLESKQQPRALAWAAEHGLIRLANMALEAGSNVDGTYVSDVPMKERKERQRAKAMKRAEERVEDTEEEEGDNMKSSESIKTEEKKRKKASDEEKMDASRTLLKRRGTDTVFLPYWWTPLHLAILNGHEELFDLLLVDHGASLDKLSMGLCDCRALTEYAALKDPSASEGGRRTWRPLHTAICQSRTSMVEKCLAVASDRQINGAQLLDQVGSTLVNPAAVLDRWRGRDHPSADCTIRSLHSAARKGDLMIMETIFKSGVLPQTIKSTGDVVVNVDYKDEEYLTPLWHAFASRQWEAIEWLVGKGANIGAPVKSTRLFDYSIDTGKWVDVLRLLDIGALNIMSSREAGQLLHHTCCARDVETCVTNEQDEDERDRLRVLCRLLELQPHSQEVNKVVEESTPLIEASRNCDLVAVDALIKAGADVNIRLAEMLISNTSNRSALEMVCFFNELTKDVSRSTIKVVKAIIDLLLEAGADILTALLAGCEVDLSDPNSPDRAYHQEVITYLIEKGGDVNARTENGDSAIAMAFKRQNESLCELLRNLGANVSLSEAEEFWIKAVDAGWIGGLRFLLGLGYADLKGPRTKDATRVLLRAMQPDRSGLGDLEMLLDAGVGPTEHLLHHACHLGNHSQDVAAARYLLARGFVVDAQGFIGSSGRPLPYSTPLGIAIRNGNSLLVQVLCKAGANPYVLYGTRTSVERAIEQSFTRAEAHGTKPSRVMSICDDEAELGISPCTVSVLLDNHEHVAKLHDIKTPVRLLYLPCLFKVAMSSRPSRIQYHFERSLQLARTILSVPDEHPNATDTSGNNVLAIFFISLKSEPKWHASETASSRESRDTALSDFINQIVAALLESHIRYDTPNSEGATALDILEGILRRRTENESGWAGRLGSVVAGVMGVETSDDGTRVLTFATDKTTAGQDTPA